MSLFDTGIRPAIDAYLLEKSKEVRSYGDYWSASSAGYCMRKVIFDRLKVPHVKEDARKTRVFEVGHVFHRWLQDITKDSGLSIAQEVELQDEDLMIRGHFDDLILVDNNLILYDYKTQNSRAFSYKRPEMSHYHKLQLGTYMYMLRKSKKPYSYTEDEREQYFTTDQLSEARILKLSKDDLRMSEEQLLWTPALEKEVYGYWSTLNGYWKNKTLPKCTCADREGGFMAREAYNPFYFQNTPCSIEWYEQCKEKGLLDGKI